MSVARGNWCRKKKITKKIERKNLKKLVQSYKNNSVELIDKLYLCPAEINAGEYTIFSATRQDGCRGIDLPKPMVYWDAVDYASGLLDADTDIVNGKYEVYDSMDKLIGALDV